MIDAKKAAEAAFAAKTYRCATPGCDRLTLSDRCKRCRAPAPTASLRVPAEDSDAMLVSVIAFAADAVAAILALQRGDSVAIAGRAKLTSWEKVGEQKHGLSVVADKVLTIYQIDKKRRPARGEAQDESAEATT
jgi:hypothetical protein